VFNALEPTFLISPVALGRLLIQNEIFLREQHNIICDHDRSSSIRTLILSRDVIVVDCENTQQGALALVG
jgi:hypothetical protein